MRNTPGLDATTGETWWRETAGLWLERARIAERERDEARALAERYREALEAVAYACRLAAVPKVRSVDNYRIRIADIGKMVAGALLVEHDSSSEGRVGETP